MGTQRFHLGEQPFINLGRCQSDLELRGGDRSDVRIAADDETFDFAVEGSGVRVTSLSGSATVRLPKASRVQVGDVGSSLLAKYVEGGLVVHDDIGSDAVVRYSGPLSLTGTVGSSLMLKYIKGQCEVHAVQADFIAKYTQDIKIDSVGATLQAAYVEGSLQVEDIQSDLILRNVEGPIVVGYVGGSAQLKNTPQGAQIEHVGGDVAVKSSFNPGTMSRFSAGGNIRIRIPRGSHVTFIMPASAQVNTDDDMYLQYEGDHLMVTVGDGLAEVHLAAEGDITLSARGTYDADHDVDYPLDSELSEELSNISMQMDEQMSRIESLLGGIGDHVRRRVERKLEVARRRVEEAQRRVEEAVESAVVDVPQTKTITINPDMERRRNDPVTDQERVMILQMLEHGTITVEEAEKLLAALET